MIIVLALIFLVYFLLPQYQRPVVFHNMLTEDECEYIKKAALPNLQPSTVGGNHEVVKNIRQSETAWLDARDPVVAGVIKRCLKHVDRPMDNCEKLQVLRYKPGGFYKPHYDAFEHGINPRMYTFIFALNEDYEGGETAFPRIKKEYKLKKGDCLLFENLDNYELITGRAYHGGKPVKSGEKWVCNLWVHKHPYNGMQ